MRLSVDLTGRTEFGPGVLSELPAFVTSLAGRAFVVTDRGLRATGIVGRVEQILAAAGIEYAVHEDISPNPPTTEIDRGAARLREFGSCAVIAVGGGSALDAAKGISLLAGNPGAAAADADRLRDTAADGLPLIAVPTTSGTGAETNGFGVTEDVCAHRKVYIGHSSVKPRIAVLDPELTLGLPARVTAATGLDALVHGIESLASVGSSPLSAAYATQAITLVGRWLPVAYRDGCDLEARSQLMFGAHLAGHALTLSGLGLVHGIGHALTAHTGTPHGVALASVLEEVMAYTRAAHEVVAHALGAASAIPAVRSISSAIEIKRPLRELGVTRSQIPVIAADAVADAVTKNAPRRPTSLEVIDLLTSVY